MTMPSKRRSSFVLARLGGLGVLGLLLGLAVSLGLAPAPARAWDPSTTHQGMLEAGATRSALHLRWMDASELERGLFSDLRIDPDRLDPTQRRELALTMVESHADVGARLIEHLGEAATFVRHHHERPDGLGYPDGLREGQIPVGAALIGVAEAYDAMTHSRPYHRTLTPTEARREILRMRGVQFLPDAVDALLPVIPA